MSNLFSLVLLCSSFLIANSQSWTRSSGTGKQYLPTGQETSFRAARRICDEKGGRLPQIMSNKENDLVTKLVPLGKSAYLNAGGHPDFTGMEWLDTTEMTFTDWDSLSPHRQHDTAVINHTGKWRSFYGPDEEDRMFMVICERAEKQQSVNELMKALKEALERERAAKDN